MIINASADPLFKPEEVNQNIVIKNKVRYVMYLAELANNEKDE